MSLLSSMIVTVCMGANGDYRQACTSALDAGTQQSGVAQDIGQIEQNGSRYADQVAENKLGARGKEYAGGVIFIIKSAADRTLIIPIPTGGFANQIQGQVKSDSAMITFRWGF